MRIELDHVFVCTAPGAPEAEEFVQFGLREGPPNQHLGQGTANRRFAFANAMIELLWVNDAEEAQNECSRRTQLWERWSGREDKASPFGICVRPVDSQNTESPFPAWQYRPSYLPDPLVMHLGEAGVEEPMIGVTHILGGVGLLIPNVPRLTEWIYAGLSIDLLLAFYSQLNGGGSTWDKFDPILVMAFVFASYVLRRCMRANRWSI